MGCDCNAGFTQGKPWIALNSDYQAVNAENAIQDEDSVFHCYARLIKLRKTYPVLTYGSYEDLLPSHPWLWCYVRRWENQTLLVIANLSAEVQEWSLDASLSHCSWVKLMGNYPENQLPVENMQLQPYEAVYWLAE